MRAAGGRGQNAFFFFFKSNMCVLYVNRSNFEQMCSSVIFNGKGIHRNMQHEHAQEDVVSETILKQYF